jgi:hypothetical protein
MPPFDHQEKGRVNQAYKDVRGKRCFSVVLNEYLAMQLVIFSILKEKPSLDC